MTKWIGVRGGSFTSGRGGNGVRNRFNTNGIPQPKHAKRVHAPICNMDACNNEDNSTDNDVIDTSLRNAASIDCSN